MRLMYLVARCGNIFKSPLDKISIETKSRCDRLSAARRRGGRVIFSLFHNVPVIRKLNP